MVFSIFCWSPYCRFIEIYLSIYPLAILTYHLPTHKVLQRPGLLTLTFFSRQVIPTSKMHKLLQIPVRKGAKYLKWCEERNFDIHSLFGYSNKTPVWQREKCRIAANITKGRKTNQKQQKKQINSAPGNVLVPFFIEWYLFVLLAGGFPRTLLLRFPRKYLAKWNNEVRNN